MMDQAFKEVFGQGILGVVLVIVLFALKDVFKRLMDSQEKRVAESVSNQAAIERNTAALISLKEVIKERV
jgi:hypothetical protein